MADPVKNTGDQNPGFSSTSSQTPTPSAFSSVASIEGVRRNLPQTSSGSQQPPAPTVATVIREPVSSEVTRTMQAAAALPSHTPQTQAPDISFVYQRAPFSQDPALQSPQIAICYLLELTVKKQIKLTRPEWIYEWVQRHQSAFTEKRKLQQLFGFLGVTVEHGLLPPPSQQYAETLSLLISRLCSPAENNENLAQALIGICGLIGHCSSYPLLTKEAASIFIWTFFMQTSLQHLQPQIHYVIFKAWRSLVKQEFIAGITPAQTDFLASMVISSRLEAKDIVIPGLISSLMLQGELSIDERLRLSSVWSHPGSILSAPAREKLLALLTALSSDVDPAPGDDDDLRWEKRVRIVDALATFGKLVQDAKLSPVSQEEMRVIGQLLERLQMLLPDASNVSQTMEAVELLFKTHSVKHLKPLERSLTLILGNASTNLALMLCLRRDTAGYSIIRAFAGEDERSVICRSIALSLLRILETIACHPPDDFPADIRIATAFHLAGLYNDFPVQLEEAPQIKTAFKALADQVRPFHDHQSMNFNELVCLLFDQFSQYETDLEAISIFLSGFGMMACNGQFTCFSSPNADKALERVLNRIVTAMAESTEEGFDHEYGVEILFWMSKLAELRLLPLLKTFDDHNYPWINEIIEEVHRYAPRIRNMKIIEALGRLAAHGRKPLLSVKGREDLETLLTKHLPWSLAKDQVPENYPELLHALGWIFVSKVTPPEHVFRYEALYRKLLLKATAESHGILQTMENASKILFFIDALQQACAEQLAATKLSMNPSLATLQIEEQVQYSQIVKSLQEGILRARQQREMNGPGARHKPQRSGPS